MSHRFPNFALVLACFFVSSFGVFDSAEILFAQMEVDFEVAAITGGDAPGTEETFELVNFPVINDEGQIAFVATLLSPTEFLAGSGVWSDVSGSIELIAVGGMQAPGTPATTFFDANIFDVTSNRHHAFRRIVLNDAGSIAFEAKLQDFELEIDTSNDIGVWVCQNGNFELLIREGDVPPGFPAGIALDFFDSENSQTDFRFNSFGTIALNTGLSGPGLTVFDRVVACGDETSLEIIAQDGESAPGTGDNFLSVGNPLLNDFGEVAFNSILPAGFSGDQAVFAEFSEVLFPVVVEGDLAPGVPLGNPRFEGVGGCSFNNAGQQIISGNAVGEDGDDFIFTGGLWLANGSSLVNVLLDNDPIVSLVDGCLFDGVSTGYLNAIGSFLVELNLVGPEVDSSNDVALISYVDGIQNAVARKGQAHRDLSDGAVFDDFSCIHFNDQNQVLFFAQLTGDAVTEDNDTALFLTDEDGVLRLVVREGDPFNVSNRGGDFRTIDYLGVVDGLGNETGTPRALNNAGEIAFWLRFTDESEAIVKTIIDGQKGPVLGDINLDGLVNLLDVDPFVQLLSLGQFQIEADLNLDGVVNLLDIEPFIDVLSGN